MQTAQTVRAAFGLQDKVAIVTGAGSGIGRTSAEVLAGAGATVYCADRNLDGATATAEAIMGAGGLAHARPVDVSRGQEMADLVHDVHGRHDRLDVMCNVAGMMVESTVLDMTEEELDAILAVNLKGVLFGCQAAGRVMVAQGSGSIVNMSSTAALAPSPNIGAYAITKSAVVQLTRTMATEVGKSGVRVNAVAPGFVPTNMTSRYYVREDGTVDEEMKAAVLGPMAKFAPLRRVGETEDIAYCVLYLASEASSFLTGQLLSPNGGVAMH
jgi:3-oxoacyl-[acyl-carrier protein] reductase